MSAPAKEAAKPAGDAPKPDAKSEAAAAVPPSPGGIKALLPLILALVFMPVLAYCMTMFVLLPKLQKAVGGGATAEHTEAAATSEHGKAEAGAKHGESKGGGEKAGGKEGGGEGKTSVALSKAVTVNVAGSMGTRYIMANMTLVGAAAGFESKIKKNDDQLRALAGSVLRTKTITDLEKPGSVNVITGELLTVFNNALGGNVVQEIYLTDFAIQ